MFDKHPRMYENVNGMYQNVNIFHFQCVAKNRGTILNPQITPRIWGAELQKVDWHMICRPENTNVQLCRSLRR